MGAPASSSLALSALVTKHAPFRSPYARRLVVTEDALVTLDPERGGKVTNRWGLAEVLGAEARGRELTLRMSAGCAVCGLLARPLRLTFDSARAAAAMCRTIRSRMLWQLTDDASDAARLQSHLASVITARPCELDPHESVSPPSELLPGLSHTSSPWSSHTPSPPSTPLKLSPKASPAPGRSPATGRANEAPGRSGSEESGRRASSAPSASPTPPLAEPPITFEVRVALVKARSLPWPPLPGTGVVVEGVWGAPRKLDGRTASDGAAGEAAAADDAAADAYGDADDDDDESVGYAPVRFVSGRADGDHTSLRWNYEACFSYAATEAQLRARELTLTLRWSYPIVGERTLGIVRVPLHDIAVGPTKYDLPVLSAVDGTAAGRVVFHAHMTQRCTLAVTLPAVHAKMRALQQHTSAASQLAVISAAAYALHMSITMESDESEPVSKYVWE